MKTPLSEKKAGTHLHNYFLNDGEHGCNPEIMTYFFHEKDVRESVKNILEKLTWDDDEVVSSKWVKNVIKKEVGEGLI